MFKTNPSVYNIFQQGVSRVRVHQWRASATAHRPLANMGSMPKVCRLAILECDTPLPNTKAKFGSYGGVFEYLLKRGNKALGRTDFETVFKVSKFEVEQFPETYPNIEDIDAILITGSRHDSFVDTRWVEKLVKFTSEVLATERIRTIGVCFGHQIVGRAMDVKVGRNDEGWEAAVNDVNLTAKGKEIFQQDKLALYQMHRDIVYEYPKGVFDLGSSPICRVQGMYVPEKILSVQGHPEFNQEIMEEIIETRHATGIFDDEAYNKHMKKVGLQHDGVVVSQAFIRFLLDE